MAGFEVSTEGVYGPGACAVGAAKPQSNRATPRTARRLTSSSPSAPARPCDGEACRGIIGGRSHPERSVQDALPATGPDARARCQPRESGGCGSTESNRRGRAAHLSGIFVISPRDRCASFSPANEEDAMTSELLRLPRFLPARQDRTPRALAAFDGGHLFRPRAPALGSAFGRELAHVLAERGSDFGLRRLGHREQFSTTTARV